MKAFRTQIFREQICKNVNHILLINKITFTLKRGILTFTLKRGILPLYMTPDIHCQIPHKHIYLPIPMFY